MEETGEGGTLKTKSEGALQVSSVHRAEHCQVSIFLQMTQLDLVEREIRWERQRKYSMRPIGDKRGVGEEKGEMEGGKREYIPVNFINLIRAKACFQMKGINL